MVIYIWWAMLPHVMECHSRYMLRKRRPPACKKTRYYPPQCTELKRLKTNPGRVHMQTMGKQNS